MGRRTERGRKDINKMMFPETQITLQPKGSTNRREQVIVNLVIDKPDHFLAFPLNSNIKEPMQYPKYAWERVGRDRHVK